MNTARRTTLIRWLLISAILVCGFCAARGALLVYFMRSTGDLSVFQPPTAEAVGREAEPFQNGSPGTEGMFKMVRQQQRHLGIMFSRLETSNELNCSLAVVGTVSFIFLSCILAGCLALLPSTKEIESRSHSNGL